MSDSWSVLDLLRWTTQYFDDAGIESARLDAECLLAHALGCERLGLYLEFDKPVEAPERARFRELVKQRAGERIPVAQLVGKKEFWSLSLAVTPDVLIPRPDTETLVGVGLEFLPDLEVEASVLDLGTGSGAIALALASERPKLTVTVTDISEAALAVAEANALALGTAGRMRFVAGDLFAPIADERFDIILSNPPYLRDDEAASLAPELQREPRGALFAGPRGTELLFRIAAEAGEHLNEGGRIAVELGVDQAESVRDAFLASGFASAEIHRDLAGHPRVVSARKAPVSKGE